MSGREELPAQRLIRLLEEKKSCLEEFLALALKQSEAIERDEEEELGKSIDARIPIMEKVDGLQRELDSLKENNILETDTEGITALEAEIAEILVRIQERDSLNIEAIRGKMQKYGEQMKNLSQSRKSIRLYNKPYAQPYSGYFDKKQ